MIPRNARRNLLLVVAASQLLAASAGAAGLEVHPRNPRWLTEDAGATAIVLSGAHTWDLFQDYDFAARFDAAGYLKGLAADGHNFTRGWFWEDDYYSPLPYVKRRGLYRVSPPYRNSYLKRLRKRIRQARRHGLYVSVMLFQGWSIDDHGGWRRPEPWPRNPYNRANTAERVTKQGGDLHAGLAQSQQLDYVAFLARRLCSQPNVIFEIANEADPRSLSGRSGAVWQRQILRQIVTECDRRLTWASCPSNLGLSAGDRRQLNAALRSLGAELVAPCDPQGLYISDPPIADGRNVVVADSDHFGVVTFEWAWKAFLRGQHPIFMDRTQPLEWWRGPAWDPDDRAWTRVRRALGAIQELVAVVNRDRTGLAGSGLADLAPQPGAGGQPGHLERPASSSWALFSSDRPCPPARDGVSCRPASANGDEVVAYAEPLETVEVCSLRGRREYRYRWKKARGDGFVGGAQTETSTRDGCLRLRNPARSVTILHLERVTG